MGWKTLKEHFDITHIVQVTHASICIGSSFVSDLAAIDLATGRVSENPAFEGFLREKYPALLAAAPEEILQLVHAPDLFAASLPVYTYHGSEIIEKQCESYGWPNLTHDGEMMYENRFSKNKKTVIAWAKNSAASAAQHVRQAIAEAEARLTGLREELKAAEAALVKLERDHPSMPS